MASDSTKAPAPMGVAPMPHEDKLVAQAQQVEHQATHHAQVEHTLTIRAAIKHYRWAIIWCIAVSMTVVMDGYDTILMGNFYAFPTFQKKYGRFVGVSEKSTSGYQLEAAWQAAVGNGSGIGGFFANKGLAGALINGYLVTKFGHRRVIVYSLMILSCFIFVIFFAPNIQVLFVGQILCGMPWGIFATSAPAYASEMLPMVLRVYFTSWTNMCFIIGQLIAAGVLRGCLSRDDEWGYKIPFAIQWLWPAMLIPLLWFAPESPWHLVRHGRFEEAEASLRRLQDDDCPTSPQETVAAIHHTDTLERELSVGTSYKDCFKGFERRRTEIACLCFAGQIMSGTPIAYNATYFYSQVGLHPKTIYNLNLGGTGLALVGAICSWVFLMPRLGRRTIYVSGTFTMGTMLYVIGILNVWAKKDHHIGMGQAVIAVMWKFVFQLSVGQLGWAIPAEIGSTRLRQKTIVLARNAYYIVLVIANVLQPYMMNPTAWGLSGYTGFVWGTTAFIVCTWAFFRLPETKDRTFEEIDILFARKVSARKFANTTVNNLESEQEKYEFVNTYKRV
ncbi:maltose permease MAL31 [Fusarium mexicanum]|uniref:Maltose permease MAL31 n=1 Tax=Fusarium mexicanum TaxID=751941 RepID=A0A8H5ICR5_9HYPO|nr:maltose permease MAL31 [Fusarium mexicanum]